MYGADVTLPSKFADVDKPIVKVRVMLLQWIGDYRGLPKYFNHTQSPALKGACYCCDVEGLSISNGKVIYGGFWRDCEKGDQQSATSYNTRRTCGSRINLLPSQQEPDSNLPPPRHKDDVVFLGRVPLTEMTLLQMACCYPAINQTQSIRAGAQVRLYIFM